MRLKKKMVFVYMVCTVLPVLLIGFFVLYIFSKSLEEKIVYSAERGFSQTYDFLQYKFNKVSGVLEQYVNSNMIREILMKDLDQYDIVEQVSDMIDIRQSFQSAQNSEDVYRIRLYVRDRCIYAADEINMIGMSTAADEKWYRLLQEGNVGLLGCPASYIQSGSREEEKLLAFAMAVKNPNQYMENIGYLRVDMRQSLIENILKNADTEEDAVTYLVNGKGEIVASSSQGDFPMVELEKPSFEAGTGNRFKEGRAGAERIMYRQQSFFSPDWTMVTVIPYSSFMKEVHSLRNRFLSLSLLFTALVCTVIYFFGKSITDRIEYLAGHMKKVRAGSMEILGREGGEDEIGVLYDNFDYMIEETVILMEEKYRLGKDVRAAELKALQSQINPHFLYNTLDMIKWLSYKDKKEEIDQAVTSLAKFYKMTLNRGRNMVTVREELEHIREYMKLQNMRYDNGLALDIRMEEALYEVSVPKITLQPLVENAILHGILEKDEGRGTIWIRGEIQGEKAVIQVKDDGVGMKEQELSRLLEAGTGKKKGSGYGVQNIHQRICLLYGAEYGLAFHSAPGQGTEVKVLLPAPDGEDDGKGQP